MTWKQFKDLVESKGVKDDDEIFSIDASGFEMDQQGDLLDCTIIEKILGDGNGKIIIL